MGAGAFVLDLLEVPSPVVFEMLQEGCHSHHVRDLKFTKSYQKRSKRTGNISEFHEKPKSRHDEWNVKC